MRYVVIEYKGSHSVSHTDRDLIGYEFSDDLGYLRDKYSLPVVTNHLDWQIQHFHRPQILTLLSSFAFPCPRSPSCARKKE